MKTGTPHVLKEQDHKKIIDIIDDRLVGEDKYLHVQWHGGEPLLELEWIKNCSQAIQDYCSKNDISYLSSMTTNGYLLSEEVGLTLKQCGIQNTQITH